MPTQINIGNAPDPTQGTRLAPISKDPNDYLAQAGASALHDVNREVEKSRLTDELAKQKQDVIQADIFANKNQQSADLVEAQLTQATLDARQKVLDSGASSDPFQATIYAANDSTVQELQSKLNTLKDGLSQGRISDQEYLMRKDDLVKRYSDRYSYFAKDFRQIGDEALASAGGLFAPSHVRARAAQQRSPEDKAADAHDKKLSEFLASYGLDSSNPALRQAGAVEMRRLGVMKSMEETGKVALPILGNVAVAGMDAEVQQLLAADKDPSHPFNFNGTPEQIAKLQQGLEMIYMSKERDLRARAAQYPGADVSKQIEQLKAAKESYAKIIQTGSLADIQKSTAEMLDNNVKVLNHQTFPGIMRIKALYPDNPEVASRIILNLEKSLASNQNVPGVKEATANLLGNPDSVPTTLHRISTGAALLGTTQEDIIMSREHLAAVDEKAVNAARIRLETQGGSLPKELGGGGNSPQAVKDKNLVDLTQNSVEVYLKSGDVVSSLNYTARMPNLVSPEAYKQTMEDAFVGLPNLHIGIIDKARSSEAIPPGTVWKYNPVEGILYGVDPNTNAIVAAGWNTSERADNPSASYTSRVMSNITDNNVVKAFGYNNISGTASAGGMGPTGWMRYEALKGFAMKNGMTVAANASVEDWVAQAAVAANSADLNTKKNGKSRFKSSADVINILSETTAVGNKLNTPVMKGVKFDSTGNPTSVDFSNAERNKVAQPANAGSVPVTNTDFRSWQTPEAGKKYDPLFNQAEEHYGLPYGLLSRQAFIESKYNPDARSKAGAVGIMQLVPEAQGVSERDAKNPMRAVDKAAESMKSYLDRFGSLDKALAAYNWGEGNLNAAIQKYGDNWRDHLPDETKNYLTKILGEG